MDQMTQEPYLMGGSTAQEEAGVARLRFFPGRLSGRWTRVITSTGKQTELFNNALDLLVAKIEQDERTIGPEFPYTTDAFGAWRTKPGSQTEGYTGEGSFGNWFCGFWIGMLLAAFLHSGRQHFLDIAISRMRSIIPHSDDRNTHDIGFNLCTSVPICVSYHGRSLASPSRSAWSEPIAIAPRDDTR